MQDLSTGEMRDLTAFLKDIPTISQEEMAAGIGSKLGELNEKLQAAKDAAQPDRAAQGPIFCVGEVIEIRGGRFQVTRIEPGHMRLKSLPR